MSTFGEAADRFNDGLIHNEADMYRLIQEKGILPLIGRSFSGNTIEGFSIEDYTPKELWFADGVSGPWDWKDPVIKAGHLAYGKFIEGKAAFVSLDLFPDLMNYRRSRFRFRPKRESKEKLVWETIDMCESLLSGEIRQACGMKRKSELDPVLTRLMMGCKVVIKAFEYRYDGNMQPYGWGIGRYTTPEALFGPETLRCTRTPEESAELILKHLRKQLPEVPESRLLKILG